MRSCLIAVLVFATPMTAATFQIESQNIRVEFNSLLHSRVIARFEGKETPLGEFTPAEFVTAGTSTIQDFTQTGHKLEKGRRLSLTGKAGGLEKTVVVTIDNNAPRMAFFQVRYTNKGREPMHISGWTNHAYSITATGGEPAFWSYQSGSYRNRPDWVLPLKAGFKQENFLGMNSTDYGGGTPVVDVWRRDVGIAIGHLERVPKLVSLPVTMPDSSHATIALKMPVDIELRPGESLETFPTFVAVHKRDYFQALQDYSAAMHKRGLKFNAAPESAFGAIWCAWGYGKTFTPAQVENALPVVKKLGFAWVGVDDGWQTNEGDWALLPAKFPQGDADMKALTDKIHGQGFRAQLWWAPLAAKPDSNVVKNHPEQLLLNKDGSQQKISYWNDWYLCPADRGVIEYHRQLVVRMFRDWGYDGLKLDGQHMNAVPPCYNPAHKHARPEESVEALPAFFKMIYDTARSIKPDALVEFCPCGTAFNYYTLANLNMSVASDPHGSWQVRTKGKTLKALHGDTLAYFGDHVELSDGRADFASTVGIGGVVGTQFTWPPGSAARPRLDLTPDKEAVWQKWVGLYNTQMLSRGEYLGGLYDIGFDRPEAHAIRKSGKMFYAFFAAQWNGPVELRGLGPGRYRITDYENDKPLGDVRGPAGSLNVQFEKHLLLRADPLPERAAVTYHENIAAILHEHCAPCHRPGQSGPFSLLTYQDAQKRAAQIAEVTRRRYMPPWLPQEGFGDFAGALRLNDAQIRAIDEWSRSGTPEGAASARPPPAPVSSEWALGPPDLVLEAPQALAMPRDGPDLFWNFILSQPLRETRFVKALEIRPGNPRVVHHANLVIDHARSSRRRETAPGQGFPGMDLTFASDTFDPDSHFLFWKPGATPRPEPEGMAWRLDPASDLILNVHLRPSGKTESIRPKVGLYFAATPPSKTPMLLKLENDRALDIPPSTPDFVISDDFRLPLDVDLLAIYPHAHYLGRLLEAFATLPDGSRRRLIRIPEWNVDWQAVYRYRAPLFLPKGTLVSMRYHYDNSAANPRNPNSSPKRIRSGNQATDEMGHLWLQVLARGGDGRPALQEALLRHRLEKYADDGAAHLGLGTLLLGRKDTGSAISELRVACRLLPGDALALNNLGAALKLEGQASEAVDRFQQALEIQPGYSNARFNLASALAAQGKIEAAAENFRRLLAAAPEDREAREQLQAVLLDSAATAISEGKLTAAAESYRELVALDPANADMHNNLGIILARMGDRAGAIAQFEAALHIQPSHEASRRNLERLRSR
jgi:alpha-galactosidase